MHLCIYEDASAANFLPLTYFRAVFDLRCGILTLREKILRAFPRATSTLSSRPFLAAVLREEHPGTRVNELIEGECLFVNGRVVMNEKTAAIMRRQKADVLFVHGEEIVGARLSGKRTFEVVRQPEAPPDFGHCPDLPRIALDVPLMKYPWDLLALNNGEIVADFGTARKGIAAGTTIHPAAILSGRKTMSIGKGSVVGPGAILDAREGPVYLGRDVRIYPGAVLEGPCAIGDGSIVRIHAKIYAGTSIGPVCKVGGEIEGSILHSHANKQHDGFLGDSYLGMWVNLGAGTTNSNLKNTYGMVRVTLNGTSINTGRMFLGLIAGDHVKAGINSTINTGTIIGPSANVFGGGFPPKSIPPFSWGGSSGLVTYECEKALSVAETVMKRRNVPASAAYKELFRHVFTMTAHERQHFTR